MSKPTDKARLQLHETTDYTKFLYNKVQRATDDRLIRHIKEIALSMQTYGFLPSKCIHVVNEYGKLRVIDGHNRLEAAKRAGIAVIYQVGHAKEAAAFIDINRITKTWTLRDYVESFAQQGFPDYITLLGYVKLGIPMTVAGGLLSGNSAASSGPTSKSIPKGEFKVKTTASCDMLLKLFQEAPKAATELKSMAYIAAISAMFPLEEFDLTTFLRKLELNPLSLVKAANRDQAMDTVEQIYNHQNRSRAPLAFLAKQRIAASNPVKARA
jgi:hypothetical protein